MRVLSINLQPLSLNSLDREVRRGCQKFCSRPPMVKFVFVYFHQLLALPGRPAQPRLTSRLSAVNLVALRWQLTAPYL